MRCHNDKGYEVFAPEDQRKRSGAEEEADDDDRLSSQSIGEPSAYRLRNHCGRELAAQDNRDLGVVEPDRLDVDRQEAEEGAVAEIHHGFDAGRDEDRRRGDDLCETLTELGHPGAQCGRLTLRGAIDIGQPQHDEKRQHPDSPDQKVGHRIAGAKVEHETADQRPSRRSNIVARGEPAEACTASGLGEARDIGRSDRREDGGREAMNKAESKQRPWVTDEWVEERWCREKDSAQNHHALAPKHVGERAGRQLEENSGNSRGGDDDTDEFRKRAEMGGKCGQDWASRHLIA